MAKINYIVVSTSYHSSCTNISCRPKKILGHQNNKMINGRSLSYKNTKVYKKKIFKVLKYIIARLSFPWKRSVPVAQLQSEEDSTKGQLISKCPFGVIIWTKIPTKKFDNFLFVFWEKRRLHKFILKLSDL